jgi:1-Cys peroxiredoxin 6
MGAALSGLDAAVAKSSQSELDEAIKKLSNEDRAKLLASLKTAEACCGQKANPLKIGANVPDFKLKTTTGDFSFHSFLTGDPTKPWTIFFSHPNDFTPVCTTELGACHSLNEDFGKMGAKLIGLSCNTTESHKDWSKDVLANREITDVEALAFPIIADENREIVSALGMLDPEETTAEGMPLPARALVILHGTTVKLTILYPATTGRNFEEVKRILISLQLTASNGLATPVNWKYQDKLIVGPAVKTEDAQAKFEEFVIEDLPSKKPYLRTVKCITLTEDMSKTAIVKNESAPPQGPNPLKIGAIVPNFELKTTQGDFKLHEWLAKDAALPWTIFFTHPKDFTPVCTTELGACHKLAGTAAKLGCKLIGLSCDDTESHHAWSKDVLARCGCAGEAALAFPIIADSDRAIVTQLGMLDPEEKDAAGVPLPARALIILKENVVKLTILYPATTGRDFDEVLRTLVSLQLTANNGLATPVDWKYGERVIVGPAVKTEDAQKNFKDFQMKDLPSKKPYLRSVACPDAGLTAP